jgi:hypothetical protein
MKTRGDNQADLCEFIQFNFETRKEYLMGLNLVGVKEQLSLFGIDIQYYCELNIDSLRSILDTALNVYIESRREDNADDE